MPALRPLDLEQPGRAAHGTFWGLGVARSQRFAGIDEANQSRTLAILVNVSLDGSIHYANSTGRQFTNTVGDILFHIINHSTYHRGQLATEFRRSRLDPLVTDYIFHKRV